MVVDAGNRSVCFWMFLVGTHVNKQQTTETAQGNKSLKGNKRHGCDERSEEGKRGRQQEVKSTAPPQRLINH